MTMKTTRSRSDPQRTGKTAANTTTWRTTNKVKKQNNKKNLTHASSSITLSPLFKLAALA